MWIFAPLGLLMPSNFPADKVSKEFVPDGSDFDLQVRARVESHLENFIRDYLVPMGLEHSAIEMTPQMDYNCRIYMSKADFAAALAAMVMDIDFQKFKPTAEDKDEAGKPLYKDGVAYHSVLNSIWGTVCGLGRPGGIWSMDYAKTTLGSARGASRYGRKVWSKDDWLDDWDRSKGWSSHDRIDGSDSLYRAQPGRWDASKNRWDDSTYGGAEWLEDTDGADLPTGSTLDFTPDSADRRDQILFSIEGIPASQWTDFISEDEMVIVAAEHAEALEAERREDRRENRLFRKRAAKAKGKHRQAGRSALTFSNR